MTNWEVRLSSSRGVPYFYNTDTRESMWEAPPDLTQEQIAALPGSKEYLPGAHGDAGGVRPAQVRASHLLVKHNGSRRPSSWKEPNITRSKEEAIQILKGYEAQINSSPEKFAELASKHSDCSSHSHGGDLGFFKPGQMQKPFEDATYALKVGEISDIISTESGVHLILRTA
ncbi:rotamase-domain-containing protein [Trametes versicolor FP-101664 SS1]|uniref:rotamase-domain-containing protein n=1 Tax=Trametes versicolor (strain FP-101664) TaxID=717944 RepID=UPI00046226A2|nr:rotamase-domain-containing protein [Trametes versicolor FP-101664 SS1]EIW63725.1 rotamase-domain-containing protein [Trametes versicolor FP-101664 SS1]